jgi:Glycosyltransferase family 87
MSIGRYTTGLVILLAVVGGAALIGYAARRRFLPDWRRAQARLAETVIAIAAVTLESLLLGALHAFNRGGILIASAMLIGAGLAWVRRIPAYDGQPLPPPARLGPWGALIAGGSAILVIWQWAVQTIPAVQQGFFEFDTLDYHLPMALHWVQTGVIGPVHQTVPGLPVGYYPANAEILHAIGMIAWQSDVLSLVLNLAWLLLALLAAWVIGQRWQAIPLAMAGTALVFAVPVMARNQPGSAMTDTPSMALLLAAVALLDRRGTPAHRLAPFAFAGLAAGLAIGTKLTVLPMLILFTLGIPLLDRRDRWRPFAAWTAAMVVGGGFWYVRNVVVIANPMPASKFPFGYLGLPTPHFGQFDQAPQSVLHYATNGPVLRQFAHDLGHGLGRCWLPLIVIAFVGLVIATLPGRDRLQRLWGVAGLLGLLIYAATPTTAGGPEGKPLLFEVDVRYALPMLSVGFVLFGACLAGHQRLSVATEAVVGLMLAGTVALRWHIPGAETQRRTVTVAGAVALVAIAALVWSVRRGRLPSYRVRRIRRISLVGGLAASAVLLVPAGAAFAGYSEDHRYAGDGTDPAQSVYAWFQHLPGDQRIATTGLALAYPLTGPHLTSRITYLGPDVKGALDDYASCKAWTAAVASSHANYLVTAPLLSGSSQEPAAGTWALHDPAFAQVLQRGAIRVFSVVGAASARSCR